MGQIIIAYSFNDAVASVELIRSKLMVAGDKRDNDLQSCDTNRVL